MKREPDASDQRRIEVGRQAVRAVAAAFKSIRLYLPGHALVQKAVDQAVTVIQSFGDRFGPLAVSATPRGVVIESSPQPLDEDVANEFARALRMGLVRSVRFLGGVTNRELSAFLHMLHLPQQKIRAGGGVSKLLRDQGIDSVVVDSLSETDAMAASAGVPALLQAVSSGPEALGAQLLAMSGGDPEVAVDLLRGLDREIVLQVSSAHGAAHRAVAGALLGPTRFHRLVQLEVMRVLDEPFALSLVVQWPPLLLEDLAVASGHERSQADMVIAAVSHTHEVGSGPIPLDAVSHEEIKAARAALAATGRELRPHALRRLIDALPALDARKVDACLLAVERAFSTIEQMDDQVAVLAELGSLARRLPDGRSELARAALHRILTTQLRDRLAASLGQVGSGHPLNVLARESPDEAVMLLLELVAEESSLHVRREIITQLQTLARGRIHLLTAYLVDPRWYIARNVVTVLGSTAEPEAVPYLRVAFAHADARVRKEALHALAQIRTPEAVALMIEGLRHPDVETQQAAAHWLGMTDSPEAADALITLLHASPLHEAVELKRAAIRSLGRLGTPEARAELQRIQSIGGLFTRRQVDDLKTEAAKALAVLREARS